MTRGGGGAFACFAASARHHSAASWPSRPPPFCSSPPLYVPYSDFGLFRSATSFFVGAAWIARQTRSKQGRRRLPGPPFFFMSRQCLHFRHSTARQPSHLPQRVRRVDIVVGAHCFDCWRLAVARAAPQCRARV